MAVLTVNGLTKRYPSFTLDRVSFSVPEGAVMGFIGRNGAGKTTTLRCLLNLIHPDAGEVTFFDKPGLSDGEIKQALGYVAGGVDYYPRKTLKTITRVTKSFYPAWDDAAYRRYLSMFNLDEGKTPAELSDGMKVKYALTLALSHHARLLLLDEPTSGLDPVSREELLESFLSLARQEGVTIFFSTHITSDLEKCADSLTYIRQGQVRFCGGMGEFIAENGGNTLENIMIEQELGRKPL